MKLSDKSLDILKNFSGINNGIRLKKGNEISTMAVDQTILAEAVIDSEFEDTFNVYELPRFLSNLSLMKDPDITISKNTATIKDVDGYEITYAGCNPELIEAPPDDSVLDISDPDAKFVLTNDQLQKLLKLGAVNEFPEIRFFGKDGVLGAKILDVQNKNSNYHGDAVLGKYDSKDFSVTFATSRFKLLPLTYTVSVKTDAYALFEGTIPNTSITVRYFIPIEGAN